MNQERIGKFISLCRNKKNLTQQELADKLGITDKAISKWENGRCLPDMSLIKPLCEELGITMNELLNGDYIKEEELKEKSESTLNQTITYIDKKEKNLKKKIYIILATITIIILLFGITYIKNYNKQTYYSLDNSNIMYEEHLNSIKKHMDEICEKDENGKWIKLKNYQIENKYKENMNNIVVDIQYCYDYLNNDKDVKLLRMYMTKGKVNKNELDYLNKIKYNVTCLNTFSKYSDLWKSDDEYELKFYNQIKTIYSIQEIPLYKKEKTTFPELNTKLLFESGVVEHLSLTLYGEYQRENTKIIEE